MSEIEVLRAENDRLRELLADNDIDPDPAPPYVAPFGPPTLVEHILHEASNRLFGDVARELMTASRLFDDNTTGAKIGTNIRIRMPNGYGA